MKSFRIPFVALALSALALFGTPATFERVIPFTPALVSAQATTTQTTLSANVVVADRVIVVASATGFAAGRTVVVDGEAMQIDSSYVSGTTIPVRRGAFSTGVTPHASGAVVFAGPSNYFAKVDPVGPCTATDQIALPLVVIPSSSTQPGTVNVYNCSGASATTQRWQLYMRGGYPAFQMASIGGTQAAAAPPTYTSAGALTILPGVSFIGSGGALAMTLAAPSLYQNGMVMVIYASTAQAHTVTYTAGFFGTTTSSDVATFGGAIGDNLVIYAQNGTWRALSTRNVTIA